MNKIIIFPLTILTVFTLVCFTISPADGIVINEPEDRTYRWEGADYVTTVEVELNDTVINKNSGESEYWFDTSVLGYSVLNENTVTLDFDVRPNSLTDLLAAPSLNSSKLTTFNDEYSFMGLSLTDDNIVTVLGDLNNVPLIVKSGEVVLSKVEPITVDKSYRATITLEDAYAGTRQARFKLGRNSFEYTVTTQQNWIDNTLTSENTSIVSGRLVLENASGADWWNDNYSYRAPITITGGRPDNYQIRIEMDGANILENFQDVRFVSDLGIGDQSAGALPYYLENYTVAGDNAVFWVLQADNEDNEIYVYWGDLDSDLDNSSPVNTFGYDVGFDSADGWTESDGNNKLAINTDNSRMEADGLSSTDNALLYHQEPEEAEWTLDFTYQVRSATQHTVIGVGADRVTLSDLSNARNSAYVSLSSDGTAIYFWVTENEAYNLSATGEGTTIAFNTTYYGRVRKFDNGGTWTVFGEYWLTEDRGGSIGTGKIIQGYNTDAKVDNTPMGTIYAISAHDVVGGANFYGWTDTVMFREYVDTEPTTSVGAAEDKSTTYFSTGEWFSTHWELGIYTTIDNFIINATTDLRGEWDVSEVTTPYGISYVPALDDYFILDGSNDRIYRYDDSFTYLAQNYLLENSDGNSSGVNFGVVGAVNMFLVCDLDEKEVDNYNLDTDYQNSIDSGGETVFPWDVEYMENDDHYYVLGSADVTGDVVVYIYDSLNAYTSMSHALSLDGATGGFNHDGEYWYVIDTGFDTIYKYDNSFTDLNINRSVGADDASPADVHSDTENIYMLGRATDSVYMYRLDNTLDNVYAMILTDTDNDNAMDENTGWHLMDENGFWGSPSISSGYNYQVGFKLETSDNEWSPRIGSFSLGVDYYLAWISVENWSDNFTVVEYDWISAENWDDQLIVNVGEGGAPPLTDITDLMVNVLIPLMILFAPAFAMSNKMGEIGFMAGLALGVMITYIAFDFSLGIVIFLMVLIAIMFMKGK